MPRLKSPLSFTAHQAEDERVQMILDLWKRSRPQEYKEFMDLVQQEHTNLVHSNGMSRDGQFAYRGMIPTTVYCVVSHYVPGYLQKPENLIKIHRMVMGSFAPKADKNFHIINRSPNANVTRPDAREVRSQDPDQSVSDRP